MTFTPEEIAALVITLSFAAGLNVPGTVATLGVLGRTQVITLPEPLALVSDWWVIGAAGALFVFEFIADKIAGFDLVWNALQTFIRVPAAAVLAWGATAALSPEAQLAAVVGGAVISLLAHGGKLALRGAVNVSPEPFSNVMVSAAEDAAAIGLTWFTMSHPYLAATIVLVLLAIIILAIRWVVRTARAAWRRQVEASHAAP